MSNRIAKVELISVHSPEVYKWIRQNTTLTIKEANELSKSGAVIDFGDDYAKAVKLYEYIEFGGPYSARIIIDNFFDRRGAVGAYAIINENN
jgi:hypothetical protein